MITDINAEVVIADIIERGFDFNNLMIKHVGLFKRNFSKDIQDAYFDVLRNLLVVTVSRDSLYDVLPYGLFHEMFSNFNRDKRKVEFDKLKQEEENARKFFLPFDNEFFNQYVGLELELREYFRNPDRFFQRILFLSKTIPAKDAIKLTTYVLFADKVIGDAQLTAMLLADLIGEEVHCIEKFCDDEFRFNVKDNLQQKLDDGISLGVDFTSGNAIKEGKNVWQFTVHLGNEKNIEKYLNPKTNSVMELIHLFYEYFIPIEVEVNTNIVSKDVSQLYLEEYFEKQSVHQTNEPVPCFLGYNTII